MEPKSTLSRFLNKVQTFMSKPAEHLELNEYDLRANFVIPMFAALGWNVENDGLSPLNYEVLREQSIVSGRPDLTFRLNGTSVFYVETKRPSVTIGPKEKWQAWKYAWNSGHSFSVITNFVSTYLIDCRSTPPTTLPQEREVYIVMKWDLTTIFHNFNSIKAILGKAEVEHGSLRELEEAISKRRPNIRGLPLELFPSRGTFPVDVHFLSKLDEWRLRLVRNLHSQNPRMDEREIVELADRLLNFVIFTRVLEDKGLEPNEPLKATIEKAREKRCQLMAEIRHVRSNLDEKYNGTVFKPFPASLQVDEGVLSDIICGTYAPESPYLLNYLPVEILGTIYERFLGLAPTIVDGRIQIATQRERQKAFGIYYTRRYITQFMVTRVLQPKLEKLTPDDIFKLRIADIAVGSGSFLVATYKSLIKWMEVLCQNRDNWKTKYLRRNQNGEWRLNLEAKLNLLEQCIYGVDIDPEAVNVSKFSLYLTALEDESPKRIEALWRLNKKPILPILDANIQCGNSIVGYDILERFLDAESERRNINPFNFADAFPHVDEQGGFDIIVGNPPYGAELSDTVREYCKLYDLAPGNLNSANLFIARTRQLIKPNGSWALIVPKSLAYSDKWVFTRDRLRNELTLAVDASMAFRYVLLEQVIIGSIREKKGAFETGEIAPSSTKLFSGARGLVFSDILPVNIYPLEVKIGKRIANNGISFGTYFRLERGHTPLSMLRATGEVKILQGKYVQGFVLIEPEHGISNLNAELLLRQKPYYGDPKIVTQQIVSHLQNPAPHVRIIAALDLNSLLSIDTVSNLFLRKQLDGRYKTIEFLWFVLGVLNSRITSWFADRFVYAKAIRTMHFDNYQLNKLFLPSSKLWNKVEFKKIASLTRERAMFKPGQTETSQQRYLKDCQYNERTIDCLVAKMFGLEKRELAVINSAFGDEVLANMGAAKKLITNDVSGIVSKRRFKKRQTKLWSDEE